jgi:hypothetical protein
MIALMLGAAGIVRRNVKLGLVLVDRVELFRCTLVWRERGTFYHPHVKLADLSVRLRNDQE